MNKKKIILAIVCAFLLFIFSIIFAVLNMGNDNIFSKIGINNINVSNKSKDETIKLLKELVNKKSNSQIKFEYTSENETYEKTIDLSLLNIKYSIEDCVNKAYSLGRTENIFRNNFIILNTLISSKNFDLSVSFDEDVLNAMISDISANLPGKIVQSSYYIEDKTLVLTRGKTGITVDKDKFMQIFSDILYSLASNENCFEIPIKKVEPDELDLEKIHSDIYKEAKDAYFEKDPFKVYAEVVGVDFDIKRAKKIIAENPDATEYSIDLSFTQPKTTLVNLDVDVFPDLLGTFFTNYNSSDEDRTTNLLLASSKINGTILSPGEEFSYNKIVGERSIKAGYKEAKVYSNGKIVDGLGGGICQISSTLYNSVVFANLKVTERFNHQFITSYVPAGRDATVAYGSKDFKFVNNRTFPIRIDVDVENGIARVDIYGIKEEEEFDVAIDVETISSIPFETKYETDSSLPAGTERIKQRGANGIVVNSFKVIKKDNEVVARELISNDKYNALDKVILKSSN